MADVSARNAQDNAAKVLKYYREVHGRDGFDNAGSDVVSLVHVGAKYGNAAWVRGLDFMLYGDGDGELMGDMTKGVDQNRKAVSSGHWPLYRYNPALTAEGKNPLQLDSKAPTISFEDYAYSENRYKMLQKANPEAAAVLLERATASTASRFEYYQKLAALSFEDPSKK